MELKLMILDVVVNSGIKSPELVDYTKLGLFPKHYYSQGLLTRTEYYFSFVDPTFSDLHVRINYVYTFADDLYKSVVTTTEYIDTNDLVGYQTAFTTNFTPQESFDIENTKRENILALAKEYMLQTLGSSDYYDLLETCAVNIALYSEGPYLPLTNQITSLVGVKPYLTAPIATAINNILLDI